MKEIYNFDLEHWGIERKPLEALNKYYKRITNSPFNQHQNLCSWDLSLEGSSEFNKKYMQFKGQSIFNPALASDIFNEDDFVKS